MSKKILGRALCSMAIALSLAAFACGNDGGDTDHACDGICSNVPDCAGVSCLSECVAREAACAIVGEQSAFQAWVSCGPAYACVSGSYQTVNCAAESHAVMACGAVVPLGDDASEPTGDGSSVTKHDGGNAPHDGGGGGDSGSSDDGRTADAPPLVPDGSAADSGPSLDSGPAADSGPSPEAATIDAGPDANLFHDASPDTSATHDSGSEAGSEAGACITGASDSLCESEGATGCIACCKSHHCSGSVLYASVYEPCICNTGGVCSTECATDFCVTGVISPNSACDTCATEYDDSLSGCFQDVELSCDDSADCEDYTTCIDSYCGA